MTLYELSGALKNFDLEIDEETGEITNMDDLEALEMARDEKVENIALFVKNLRAEAEAIAAEEKRLHDRRKATENKAARLMDYLQLNLAGEKFKTPKVAISYRKTRSTVITDVTQIPAEYVREVYDIKPDKTAIKKAIDGGAEIPGAYVEERQSMVLK